MCWDLSDFCDARQLADGRVKCLLCDKELGYNNNTSSMLRHYRALHEKGTEAGPGLSHASRKQLLDDALVDMVVKDSQPFTLVEDEEFRGFVNKLNPLYVLPTRQAFITMVAEKVQKVQGGSQGSGHESWGS